MKISFVTTCMGRLSHLQRTLPRNIRDNPGRPGMDVEFVVLNYGDTKEKNIKHSGLNMDTDEWVRSDPFILPMIENGTVRYAHFTEPEKFHMAHAKNMAHRAATGDVICNLDADNFAGEGFAAFLTGIFAENEDIIVNPDFKSVQHLPPEERGFYGRIAVSRKHFFNLGGYNEEFVNWGGDDSNFRRRAKGYGLRHIHFKDVNFLRLIAHSNADRVCNMQDPEAARRALEERMANNAKLTLGYKLHEAFSTAITPVQANKGKDFGCGEVYINFNRVPEVFAPEKVPHLSRSWISAFGAVEMLKGRFRPTIVNPSVSNNMMLN